MPLDLVPEGVVGGLDPAVTGRLTEQLGVDAWHAAGRRGQGITVGVIDFTDVAAFWSAALGPAPTPADVFCRSSGADCAADFFDGVDAGGESHGPAVAAVIRAIAPDARLVFGRATSLADYRELLDWFAGQGVTIVNRSLGTRYDGPGDGRGGLDAIVDEAVGRGMLWVNSGGNNGSGKYYRGAVTIRDGWVDFGGTRYLPFTGSAQLAGVRWAGDWDLPAAERTDYDVVVTRAPDGRPEAGTVIASSTLRQRDGARPLEALPTRMSPAAGERLYLSVRHVTGDVAGDVLEILDFGDGFTSHTTTAGSAAVPAVDSRSPGAISVGAIDPPASGAVASYSAQGPTTDGRVVPSITAPTGYPNPVWGTFSGTSAAAAATSGVAALLAGAGLGTTPTELATALRSNTVDRGAAGPDNTFGAGELRLPAVQASPSAAGVASRYVGLAPTRLLDTRTQGGPLAAGEARRVTVTGTLGIPADGVTAIAVNAVSVGAAAPGYLQLLPTGQALPGAYSNVNIDAAGQVRANFAVVPVGDGGSVSVHASAGGDVVLDVLGYFVESPGPTPDGRFVELATPERALDTRAGAEPAPMGPGSRRSVPMPRGVDPAEVAALVVTVTGTEVTGSGWVQAYPTGDVDAVGSTSTINLAPGATVANLAIVPVGQGGISIASNFAGGGAAHVVVDVVGYITAGAAAAGTRGRFVAVAPTRAFDSRTADGTLADRAVADVAAPGVPADAGAVVWNAAIVGATRPGYLRAWAAAAPRPATSALNWSAAAETRAAAVISRASAATSSFLVDDGGADLAFPLGDLIVDVFGYFTG